MCILKDNYIERIYLIGVLYMLKNLKVRLKILILTFTLNIIIIIIGLIGITQLNNSNKRMSEIYDVNFYSVFTLSNALNEEAKVESSIYKIIMNADNPSYQKQEYTNMLDSQNSFNNAYSSFRKIYVDEYASKIAISIDTKVEKYREKQKEVVELAMNGKAEEAKKDFKKLN